MNLDSIWAKRGNKRQLGPYHPLLCHLIDVAEIARGLLDDVVSKAEMRWLAEGFGIDEASTSRWLVVFAGLHDLGKACHGFQEQIPGNSRDVPHGTVSARVLRKRFAREPFNLDPGSAKKLAFVIGGHHGVIPSTAAVTEVEQKTGEREWRAVWPELTNRFLDLYSLPDSRPIRIDNAQAMWLAGFISAADWIGSNTTFFPFAATDGTLPADFDLATYRRETAEPMARKALHDLGWFAIPTTTQPLAFTELFPSIVRPNELQKSVMQIANELTAPGLVIIEAPMGRENGGSSLPRRPGSRELGHARSICRPSDDGDEQPNVRACPRSVGTSIRG